MNGRGAFLPSALVLAITLTGLSTGGQQVLPEHPAQACSFPFHIQGAGWDLCWQQDDVRGQGIELNQVYFHDEMAIWKIGFPFSITRYEDDAFGPFKDTLGQSYLGSGDNPGFGRGSMQIPPLDCPRFLGQGTLFNDQRVCVESRQGPEPAIAVWGRYDIFNYRFLQGYILDSRGVIEPFVRLGGLLIDGDGSIGGAVATNHFHHLFWRVDMDIGEEGSDGFEMFLRPHEDWNNWDPYWVVENTTDDGMETDRCARFAGGHGPPDCPVDNRTLVDPLEGFPEGCKQQVRDGTTGWCGVINETALLHHPALFTKWRIQDPMDTNRWGRAKSLDSTGHTHVNVPSDGAFTTFDALALQYAGDSGEIGFNVPSVPLRGDEYLKAYLDPPQAIDDPVMWFAGHAYHDTRDEEIPTMSYHHISFEIQPRNLLHANPGEDSYSGSLPIQPPGDLEPEPCIGPVCIG